MQLNEKQLNTFYDTLIKIVEDKENVKINYSLVKINKKQTKKGA